jgi:hypothetical protein
LEEDVAEAGVCRTGTSTNEFADKELGRGEF